MLASSVQAIQGLRTPDRSTTITLEDGTSPTNHYSLTKVFSEDIGQMYARGVEPRFAEAGEVRNFAFKMMNFALNMMNFVPQGI